MLWLLISAFLAVCLASKLSIYESTFGPIERKQKERKTSNVISEIVNSHLSSPKLLDILQEAKNAIIIYDEYAALVHSSHELVLWDVEYSLLEQVHGLSIEQVLKKRLEFFTKNNLFIYALFRSTEQFALYYEKLKEITDYIQIVIADEELYGQFELVGPFIFTSNFDENAFTNFYHVKKENRLYRGLCEEWCARLFPTSAVKSPSKDKKVLRHCISMKDMFTAVDFRGHKQRITADKIEPFQHEFEVNPSYPFDARFLPPYLQSMSLEYERSKRLSIEFKGQKFVMSKSEKIVEHGDCFSLFQSDLLVCDIEDVMNLFGISYEIE